MDTVFFGSSDFSVESLRVLAQLHRVAAVFTQPDRRKGRHLHLSETPVKIFAGEHGLPVFQPENVNTPEIIARLNQYNADVFVVVSFGQKLSPEVLAIPKKFCVNVHSSLLPRWRGAAPINRAITDGDSQTGVTVMKMNEYMDRGDIILSRTTPISGDDDAVTLSHRLAGLGAQALQEALAAIEQGTVHFTAQDEALATIAKKLKKEDGAIDWRQTSRHIHDQVRGLLPWPCGHTHYKGMFIKILKTSLITGPVERLKDFSAGQIIAVEKKKGIVVAAGDSALLIETMQSEGKRAMSAYDFVLGHHVRVGDVFNP